MSEDDPGSSFGGLKDFSVDAQRRMFVQAQERERQAAENKKASRKIKQTTAGADSIAMSGLMSSLENGTPAKSKMQLVGADDDDSIADDWSLGSEESFYVGIERADYAQPDNLEMYGEEKEEDYEIKEDRLGISRVSVAIVNRADNGKVEDWDADIPIHDEKSSSLHEFMNGVGAGAGKARAAKKDVTVAMPLVGTMLEWKEESKLGDEGDAAIDQVYEHKAAEGKTFIDKFVGSSSTPGKSGSVAAEMATPGAKSTGGGEGHYPVLSPMALFSPGITTPGVDKVVEGEDNGVRQMRERELKRAASTDAHNKMAQMKKLISSSKDSKGKVDAYAMMKQMEKLMAEWVIYIPRVSRTS